MKDLIKALNIFAKYSQESRPIWCHDSKMYVYVLPSKVSDEDILRLQHLGFDAYYKANCFTSDKFGSSRRTIEAIEELS